MASLFCVKTLVEYGANLVSDFDPMDSCLGGESFYCYFGKHGLYLIKNITPLRVSLMRKIVWASESKLVMLALR
jgi:hypothetical protein